MKTMKTHRSIIRKEVISLLLLAFIVGALQSSLHAVEAVPGSAQVFTAMATVEGPAPVVNPIVIRHTAIQGISSITKLAIIQGQAGTNPTNAQVPFRDRVFPSDSGTGNIRVRLFYRFVGPSDDPTTIPFTVLVIQSSEDPLPFAFQIPPSEIGIGTLEYKIIAERLEGNVPVAGQIAYYPPESKNNPDAAVQVGVEAGAARVLDINGGRVEVYDGNPNDGVTYLDIPAGILSPGTDISLTQIPTNSSLIPPLGKLPAPLAMYRLDSGESITSGVLLNVLYPDFVYPEGQDGLLDGTNYDVQMAALAYWDGHHWRRLGSRNNTTNNTLMARIGNFQYVGVFPLGASTLFDSKPTERIITPNGDTENETVVFDFGDPFKSVTVDLYDVNGHRIRSLRGMGQTEWDGRDDSGKIVESGVYIYQYESDGERISGLIAVAK